MSEILLKRKATAFPLLLGLVLLLAFSSLTFAQGYRYKSADAWSFGVMGDTQWTPGVPGAPADPEGLNPNFVAGGNARKLNEQFISHDVRFVFQLGDLSNWSGDAAPYSRAEAAQPLYDFGIGFFPVRGNHETYGYIFGLDSSHTVNIPAFLGAFPQTQGLANTFGATDFTHPNNTLKGLSYSFDYGYQGNNARFLVVDTEVTSYKEKPAVPHPIYGQGYDYPSVMPTWVLYKYTEPLTDHNPNNLGGTIEPGNWFRIDSSGYPSTDWHGWDAIWPIDDFVVPEQTKWSSTGTEFFPGKQQAWISERLDVTNEERPEHAFVLTHRGPMNQNHTDSMFGSSPGSKAADQNVFYNSLQSNGVRYVLAAHDHLYSRSLVKSPDGKSQIEEVIATGASTKFYEPVGLDKFNNAGYGDVKKREAPVAQELYNIGYYIYTVDGPRVLVDYYSDSTGGFEDDADFPYGDASVPERLYTPQFNFVKKDSWGYSLNGKQFVVKQGESYTVVEDSFGESSAKILGGVNESTATDYTPVVFSGDTQVSAPRPLVKNVNTGWVAKPVAEDRLKSDILSLWGMADFPTEQTDAYVLAMLFKPQKGVHLGNEGGIGTIVALNEDNEWVNAVDLNFGGKKRFISGPYSPRYGLGTYGFDPSSRRAWAVLNYNADFAVVNDIVTVPPGLAKTRSGQRP